MFRYYDYNDLLEYIFIKTSSFDIIDFDNFVSEEILID